MLLQNVWFWFAFGIKHFIHGESMTRWEWHTWNIQKANPDKFDHHQYGYWSKWNLIPTSYFQSVHALIFYISELSLGFWKREFRTPIWQKVGVPFPKSWSPTNLCIPYIFNILPPKWYIWIIFRSTDFNPVSNNGLFLLAFVTKFRSASSVTCGNSRW